MLITILAFIFVLGILITVHELGHFIAAKCLGVKVEEFSIGFPPRIFAFKKGETKYSVGLLLFGGYVKMLGEDGTDYYDTSRGNLALKQSKEEQKSLNDPRAFNRQKPGSRFIISVAGVLMNFALAWLILSIGFMVGMTPPVTPSDQVKFGHAVKGQVYIAEILPDSAAEQSGLLAGDQLVGLSSSGENIEPTALDEVSDFTGRNLGKEIVIKAKRNNQPIEKVAKLSSDKNAPLGVAIINQSIVRVPWYVAPYVAMIETWGIIKVIFMFLGNFIGQLFQTRTLSDQVGGPVAIFNLSGSAAKAGTQAFFQFIAMLSVNLGLINILPIPALDGGRALFIILEKIFGKRIVKENIENIIHNIGFALLMLLILAVTFRDVAKLFHK